MKDRYRKYRIPRIADNQIRDLRDIRSLLLHTIIRRFAESIPKAHFGVAIRLARGGNHIVIS